MRTSSQGMPFLWPLSVFSAGSALQSGATRSPSARSAGLQSPTRSWYACTMQSFSIEVVCRRLRSVPQLFRVDCVCALRSHILQHLSTLILSMRLSHHETASFRADSWQSVRLGCDCFFPRYPEIFCCLTVSTLQMVRLL